ncbi:Ypk2p [Rhizophagus irregularis DAOM 197198w]|uniref:Ypk2p n=2 Tax=Rhizophagus irregularis TaxID=588596 RepID=A0A015JLF6_RHIIW|nr:Ypk2p [Rhizophagus irregularis DAOM 197198w]
MSLQCKRCGNEYTDKVVKWCRSCQINSLKNYIIINGNEKIDEFIKEMQLKVNSYYDIVFEWIPYSHFNNIEEISGDGYITVYSAIWHNSPLYYDEHKIGYTRYQFCRNKNVILKCLYDSQIITNKFLNKVNTYSIKRQDDTRKIYGISQNPDTKDYIMVLEDGYCEKCDKKHDANHKWYKSCQINYLKRNFTSWTSGNENIDQIIQEMQLKIESYNDDIVFEWIPYYQFYYIEEIGKDGYVEVHSATWEGSLLCWYNKNILNNQKKNQYKKVILKHFRNSQTDKFSDKVNAYSIKQQDDTRKIYGISQNPDTKDYIMVLEDGYCEKCDEKHDAIHKWYKSCQISYLKSNFTNWTSGNENIDQFIQEMQLKIKSYDDIVFEWIPYDKFYNIEKIGEYGYITVHSAIWRGGLLHYNENIHIQYNQKESYNKKVTLKFLCNLRYTTHKLQNEVNAYSINNRNNIRKIFGISQNPQTKDYIMVLEDGYCEKCDKKYTDTFNKWCKLCQINYLKRNFTNWTSGNKKIDQFIQNMQLKIDSYYDIVFEWISYSQFSNIKKISNDAVYSAIWTGDLLCYNEKMNNQENQNKNVALKRLCNPQYTFIGYYIKLSKVNAYSIKRQDEIRNIYGISQNPDTKDYIMVLETNGKFCEKCDKKFTDINHKWCKPCQLNYFKSNFTNWTSGNKIIDQFIQEIQLKIDSYDDIVFEWMPYNQFDDIKEIGEYGYLTIYSAIWKYDQLCYDGDKTEYTRKKFSKNKFVTLKCFHNSQTDKFSDKINAYSIENQDYICKIYGISQNPHTKDYIMVLEVNGKFCEKCDKKYTDINHKWCKPCQLNYLKRNFTSWTSGNEKIDRFIQEIQLKIDSYDDTVFEWMPYNQFDDIKEISEYGHITIYSAIWKYDQLCYDGDKNTNVTLKCFRNSQTDEFLDKVNAYSIKNQDDICKIYGISQNPHTKDYIIVLEINGEYCEKCDKKYTDINHKWCKPCQLNYLKRNFASWTSGNEKIDQYIQVMQLKIESYDDTVFEWIPYYQFYNIKEIGKNGYVVVHSAIWKGNLLWYNENILNYQKVNAYSIKNQDDICKIYGISQNPHTKDYIMVLEVNGEYCENCDKKYTDINHKWCKPCQLNYLKSNSTNWTSGNEVIDQFILEIQLKIDSYKDIVFEWIPYNQFSYFKEIYDNNTKIYSAIWKDGPLHYYDNVMGWTRKRSVNMKVILKYLHNLQDIIEEFYNEYNILYGISQDPNINGYIVIQAEYCKKCGEKYMEALHSWYNPCKIDHLKSLTSWTSRNETIDDIIKKAQLNNSYFNNTFEWISYDQFNDIKEIGKGGFATVYSAIWKDGPLYYNNNEKKWIRKSGANKKVALKCLHNSQNITNELLHEAKVHSMKKSIYILNFYGISQNPDSKEYIMVLDYIEGGDFNKWMTKNHNKFNWSYKLLSLWNTIRGLKEIHQKQMVHRDFHTGNVLVKNEYWPCISDMGLCGKVDDIDETKIFGVMPYVAPEVLKGEKYTQAADIYSLGMFMYFIATGKQPFYNRAHDQYLVISICEGVRPEINEPEAPICYIDLMKRCWDSNPDNRPNINEIFELMELFNDSKHNEIGKQLKEAEGYRKANPLSIEVIQSNTHPQAIYTSRLLNSFTKSLSKYDNVDSNSVEIIDFTKLC